MPARRRQGCSHLDLPAAERPNGARWNAAPQPAHDADTDPVTIQPARALASTRRCLSPSRDIGENLPDTFRPVVVADARYTLADGSEGRTSASFEIGVTPEEGEGLDPIELSRSSMHENVGAELHGEPQRA